MRHKLTGIALNFTQLRQKDQNANILLAYA